MRLSKRTAALCAFVVGTVVLVTSAFADVMIESGYYSLKNSAKTTMAKLTTEVDNFTINIIASAKVDDQVFVETNERIKYDMVQQARESTGKNNEKGEITENYNYSDKNQNIYKDFQTGKYHVYYKRHQDDYKILGNPFEEEQAEDVEKIVDAFVGSLQDTIQVEQIDGKKVYIGNLSDTQVPSLMNAILSFALKYSVFDERTIKESNFPYPKTNIFISSVSGKAVENENGILESIIGRISLTADDKDGSTHLYTVELSIEIFDVNNTAVNKPDLTGEDVEYSRGSGYSFDEKYIGTYKNDIVGLEGNTFVKKGERILEITSVQDNKLMGTYREVYNDVYESDDSMVSFDFITDDFNSGYYLAFHYQDKNGEDKTGIIQRGDGMQNLNVVFDVEIDEDGNGYSQRNYDENFDNNFIRVFE